MMRRLAPWTRFAPYCTWAGFPGGQCRFRHWRGDISCAGDGWAREPARRPRPIVGPTGRAAAPADGARDRSLVHRPPLRASPDVRVGRRPLFLLLALSRVRLRVYPFAYFGAYFGDSALNCLAPSHSVSTVMQKQLSALSPK